MIEAALGVMLTAWLFIVGWPLLVGFAVIFLIVAYDYKDEYGFGLFWLAVFLGALHFAKMITLPTGWDILLWLGIYFAAGAVWSLYKWIMLIRRLKRTVEVFIASGPTWDFYENNARKQLTWEQMTTVQRRDVLWRECICNSEFYKILESEQVRQGNLVPSLTGQYNRGKILDWIMGWPFSVLNYVFDKLLRDIAELIIDSLKGIYNTISEQILKGLRI